MENEGRRPNIAFLFTGGEHQFLHLAPVAAAMSIAGESNVMILIDTQSNRQALNAIFTRLGAGVIPVRVLALPAFFRYLAKLVPSWSSMKLPRLFQVWHLTRQCDALVVAERTSSFLKRIPGFRPLMIHIPHGAGDRAKGFEKRIKLFDMILVAGEKDRKRMIGAGIATEENCLATGYVKLGAVRKMNGGSKTKLFDNDRPIVLYNPHFDQKLSSWTKWGGDIIAAFAGQQRYNLIVAPHVRLFADAAEDMRATFLKMGVEDCILMDPGSARSNDMSYTLAADIYLGDVSSQTYEFISTPRPSLFLNAHGVEWRNNPDYAFWHFGEVLNSPVDLLAAIDRAVDHQKDYFLIQSNAALDAMGDPAQSAERASEAILRAVGNWPR